MSQFADSTTFAAVQRKYFTQAGHCRSFDLYQKGKKLISEPIKMTTMKNTANTTSKTRFTVLFVLLLLSSVGMFGQNVQNAPAAVAATEGSASVEANPNINMVSWFMGTKQTPKASNESAVSNKKQMINSGIAPNGLLIKAFLKKANDFQSSVA